MYLFGENREVSFVFDIDNGGMFPSTAGVYKTVEGKYRAFVQDGWGAGVAGKHFDTAQEARRDIERLTEKYL